MSILYTQNTQKRRKTRLFMAQLWPYVPLADQGLIPAPYLKVAPLHASRYFLSVQSVNQLLHILGVQE
jgi:hypothetical protein